MRVGPTPVPVQAAPAVGLLEVTNGYVPWSMSSRVPCAPSNSTVRPSRIAVSRMSDVSAMNGWIRGATASTWSATASASRRGSP